MAGNVLVAIHVSRPPSLMRTFGDFTIFPSLRSAGRCHSPARSSPILCQTAGRIDLSRGIVGSRFSGRMSCRRLPHRTPSPNKAMEPTARSRCQRGWGQCVRRGSSWDVRHQLSPYGCCITSHPDFEKCTAIGFAPMSFETIGVADSALSTWRGSFTATIVFPDFSHAAATYFSRLAFGFMSPANSITATGPSIFIVFTLMPNQVTPANGGIASQLQAERFRPAVAEFRR